MRAGEDRSEKLRFVLLLLFVFSLPYDLFYSNIIFITLAAISLLDVSFTKLKRIPKQFWLFQSVYFLVILTYSYSLHKNVAGFLLERQVAILLFPLLLPIAIQIRREKLHLILLCLAFSSATAILYLFLHMGFTIHYALHLPLFKTAFSGAFFNHQFSRPIGIHAGYFSLYTSLSIIYLVTQVNKNDSSKYKSFLLFCLVTCFAGLFFLASRNTIISTFIILLLIFPLFQIRRKIRYLVISLSFVVLAFLAVKNVPYLKERFSVELISDIKPLDNGKFINYSSTEPRIERWKCAAELIKASPVLGYGSGDEVEMLKTKYAEHHLFISYLESFNAHNQYLSIWLKNGIIGLLLFLAIFFYYCKLAISKKDFVYFAFLVLLLIGFYTENILDANKGIVFFAFFNTMFGYKALNSAKEVSSEL